MTHTCDRAHDAPCPHPAAVRIQLQKRVLTGRDRKHDIERSWQEVIENGLCQLLHTPVLAIHVLL